MQQVKGKNPAEGEKWKKQGSGLLLPSQVKQPDLGETWAVVPRLHSIL